MKQKPKAELIGANGNIFNLMGIARNALKDAGQQDSATEMSDRVFKEARNYDQALAIIMEYVEVE